MKNLITKYSIILTFLFFFIGSEAFGQQGNMGGNRPGGGKSYSGQGAAKGLIKGVIFDKKTNQPLEYVTVAVFKVSDKSLVTGNVTNAKGEFFIKDVPPGKYFVKVNYIGYEPFIKNEVSILPNKPFVNMGQVKLANSATKLDEVAITAHSEFSESSIDRKTYQVSKLSVTKGSTANEVLQVIPSVEVDIDGNISLRGSENVTVLIDGKPSGLTGENISTLFEALPANMIEKIEVVTNPSAKYDPDGMTGIINIITKKNNKLSGTTGNISANYGVGGYHSFSGMLSMKKNKLSFNTNLSFNYRDAFTNGKTNRDSDFEESIETLDQRNNGNMVFKGGMFRFSGRYQFDKKNELSFGAMINFHGFERDDNILYEFRDTNNTLTNTNQRITEFKGDMFISNYNLGYTKNFAKKGHKLDISGRISEFNGDFDGDFKETPEGIVLSEVYSIQQISFTDVSNVTTTVQADYSLPLKNNSLFEAGYKSILRDRDSDFKSESRDDLSLPYENDENLTNFFKYDEDVHSLYATYKQNLKKFGYQVGLRLEQAEIKSELVTTNEIFYNDYFSLFPTVHLTYNLGKKQQLKASYSRRVNRPRGRALNPFANFTDPQNIRIGNPFLVPEFIDSYEIGYEKSWEQTTFSVAAYYRQINNMITRIKTVSSNDENNNISTTTFENLDRAENYGLELVFQSQIKNWWSVTASANAFQMKIFGTTDSEFNNDGYALTSKLLSTWTLNEEHGLKLQLSMNYRSPRIVAQGEISEIFFSTVALSKKVMNKKGTISIRVTDLLDTREFNFETSGENFSQDSFRKRESQFVQLGFSYNFGKLRNRRGGRRGGMNRGEGGDGGEVEID